jgi:hypothetical protein
MIACVIFWLDHTDRLSDQLRVWALGGLMLITFVTTCVCDDFVIPEGGDTDYPFSHRLLTKVSQQERVKTPAFSDHKHEFFIVVDPPTHAHDSWLGIRAFMFAPTGEEITFGLSELKIDAVYDVAGWIDKVSLFIKDVRLLPYIGDRPCIKIIESQNRSFLSGKISKALDLFGHTDFPVIDGELSSFVWDGVGVSTTLANHTQGIQRMRAAMNDGLWQFTKEGVLMESSNPRVYWDGEIEAFITQCGHINVNSKPTVSDPSIELATTGIIGTVWAHYYTNKNKDRKCAH